MNASWCCSPINFKVSLRKQVKYQRYQQQRKLIVLCKNTQKGDRGIGILEWTGGLISQGTLVKGVKGGWRLAWQAMMKELAPQSSKGEYKRPTYNFQGQIGVEQQFPNEYGRYHLYVGNACPWCHKVLMVMAITGAADGFITYSQLQDDAERASRGGWVFDENDPVFNAADLRQVYDICSPGFTGRCTAPLLIDKKLKKIVCNESSIIIKNICDLDFQGRTNIDLYPQRSKDEIDVWEKFIYDGVNNAVYRSGFATTQIAYDQAQSELYKSLEEIEQQLRSHRFLLGDKVSVIDVQLYPTVARFDSAYMILFKCSRKRISDYPNLSRWFGDMYNLEVPGVQLQIKDTFDFDDARRSYFEQLFPLNPGGIIPAGPTFQDIFTQYLKRESFPEYNGSIFYEKQFIS
eukprot:TRINITY_DN20106_c0_g1_i5.p2 TRINITY_DN20106_c0_g1~~TRINITY_DN20106_c0_g1_i5.p2  ORF type:complete len:404 (-),score=29.56 TRINITY_DN20106_c0_g1_i5:376-1587(-)